MSRHKPIYCVDTSSLIRAWSEAYPIDVVSTFWDRLDDAISTGVVITSDEVLRETTKRSDDLHTWLKDRAENFVVEIDDDIQEAVAELLARNPLMAKNRKGASSADSWVVALAKVRGATVVSEETMTDSEKRPKIPGVCAKERTPCLNLLGFMRAAGWRI